MCVPLVYADGALGSRGACLLEPCSDKPPKSINMKWACWQNNFYKSTFIFTFLKIISPLKIILKS